jgi:hypothetical protein
MVPDDRGGAWTRRPGTRRSCAGWRSSTRALSNSTPGSGWACPGASPGCQDRRVGAGRGGGGNRAPAACLEWSVTGALAAGATEDEITGVLLAIAPVARLGRVVSAVPGLAFGLEYDIETALMETDES